MKTKRITISFKTPPLSPLHADTFFGHYCWHVKDIKGEGALKEFLSGMKERPLFLISDLFPAGYLPRPMYSPDHECAEKNGRELKRFKRMRYIKKEDVIDGYDIGKVIERSLSDDYAPRSSSRTVIRSSVDRMSGGSLKGALFHDHVTDFYGEYDLYVASDDVTWFQSVHDCLMFMKDAGGYGADRSCGFGQLGSVGEPVDVEPALGALFKASKGDRLALSGVVPVNIDLSNSRYKLRVKYGKLSGEFVYPNPFKRPVVFLECGSVIVPKDVNVPTGCLVQGVAESVDPGIVQYGWGLHMGLNYKE